MTEVVELSDQAVPRVAECLRHNGVVVLPTDTNYNVMACPFDRVAVERVFAIKKRSSAKPLTLWVGNTEDAARFTDPPPSFHLLANHLWPGPISLILSRNPQIPGYVVGGLHTIAVAFQHNPFLRDVCKAVGFPLAGTSANFSGAVNQGVTDFKTALTHLGPSVDLVVRDPSPSKFPEGNTILDLTCHPPVLVRNGPISRDTLEALVGPIVPANEPYFAYLESQRSQNPPMGAGNRIPRQKERRTWPD